MWLESYSICELDIFENLVNIYYLVGHSSYIVLN